MEVIESMLTTRHARTLQRYLPRLGTRHHNPLPSTFRPLTAVTVEDEKWNITLAWCLRSTVQVPLLCIGRGKKKPVTDLVSRQSKLSSRRVSGTNGQRRPKLFDNASQTHKTRARPLSVRTGHASHALNLSEALHADQLSL